MHTFVRCFWACTHTVDFVQMALMRVVPLICNRRRFAFHGIACVPVLWIGIQTGKTGSSPIQIDGNATANSSATLIIYKRLQPVDLRIVLIQLLWNGIDSVRRTLAESWPNRHKLFRHCMSLYCFTQWGVRIPGRGYSTPALWPTSPRL